MALYFIGLDIGTTSTKAVAFDQLGNTIETASVSYPTLYPAPNQAVQKAEAIWDAVKSSIKQILETIDKSHQLAGVGVSSAMHSLLPVDAEGNPLSDLMIWSDNRADNEIDAILANEGDVFYSSVGVPLHPMTPFAKLIWAQENNIDWYHHATLFLGIKEWVWQKLTGRYEMDYSMAGSTGMFNVYENDWHAEALKRVNITKDKLPALVDTLTVRECTNNELFPKGIKLVIGASDGCLANLGAGAFRDGDIAVTIGTSAAARAVVSKPLLDIHKSTFCYYLAPEHYVVGGGANSGGVVVEWFVKNFADNNYDTFFEWIDSVSAGSEGIICLPYIQGERAPVWDSSAQGVFYGLNMHHSRRHLARALMEGILLNIKQIIETVDTLKHTSFIAVKVGGGSAISPVVLQLLSDVLGVHVYTTHTSEHSAWGASMMAMLALGYIEGFDEIPNYEPELIFSPKVEDKAFYNRQLEKFKELYRTTKNIQNDAVR